MPNYNSQLQSNNTDLQTVLQALQTKAAGGEQATPEISVNTSGLITATAGVKSATYQLAFQPAKTITPSTASQIAVSSGYYTGGNVTVDGDSNLVPENIKSGVSIFGVSGVLESDRGTEIEDAFITKTIRVCTNNRITSIGSYTFYMFSGLTSISFPVCTSIGHYAFCKCISLTSVSFPACTSIHNAAFSGCNRLVSANFPNCQRIEESAFYSCSRLTSIIFPVCTRIERYAFYSCSSLTSVSFPVCTSIGSYAFCNCSSLTSVNFPVCTEIYMSAFIHCKLTSVSFPVCKILSVGCFLDCSVLTKASFPMVKKIYNSAFNKCYNLSRLYLGAPSVCTLSNSNAFTSTPYAGYSASFSGIPYIYVPSSLINSYKTATNWTYFSSYFSAIEDAPDWDGTYGDNSGNQSSGGNQDGGHSGGEN